MSAKKAAAKKKAPASKKKLAKKAASTASRSSKAKLKPVHKPSAKTGKSAKRTSVKKVPTKLAAPKAQPKPSGKKTIATVPKKPGSRPAGADSSRRRNRLPPVAPKRRRSGGNVLSGPVKGFTPYQPKRGEEYMNKDQLEHFRQLLLAWKRELMEEVDRTMLHMKDDAANFPDPNDRATQESEFGLELRTRDRERKLLKKIDSALWDASTTAATATARRPATRSACAGSRHAPSRRCASKRRSGASSPRGSSATARISTAEQRRPSVELRRPLRPFSDRPPAPGVARHRRSELPARAPSARRVARPHRRHRPAARGCREPPIRSCGRSKRSSSSGIGPSSIRARASRLIEAVADRLLAAGLAFRCRCSRSEIRAANEGRVGALPRHVPQPAPARPATPRCGCASIPAS